MEDRQHTGRTLPENPRLDKNRESTLHIRKRSHKRRHQKEASKEALECYYETDDGMADLSRFNTIRKTR